MGTSAVVMIAAAPVFLESYLAGRWVRGEGEGAALVDPATGEVVARASTVGLNIEGALRYAREVGQPALRALRYAPRCSAGSRTYWLRARTSGTRSRSRTPETRAPMPRSTSTARSAR